MIDALRALRCTTDLAPVNEFKRPKNGVADLSR